MEFLSTLAAISSTLWVRDFGSFTIANLLKPQLASLFISALLPLFYRVQNDQAIAQNEQLFATFMDNLPGFVWMKDIEGRYVYVNQRLQRIAPYQSGWLGRTDAELWPGEIAATFRENDLKIIATAEKAESVESFVLNGEQRHVLASRFPIFDEHGTVIMVGGTGVDITEYKRVEETLRESESFRRMIIESEPECVKLVAPDYTLLDMNPAGLEMIGATSREQVVGQSVLSLIAPEFRSTFMRMHQRVCQGESVVTEFEIVGLKGSRRLVESHAAPLHDQESRVIGQLAITRDVTERKRAQEQLRRLSDNAHAVRDSEGIPLYYEGTTQDIAARKLVEEALRESEERYRELFENAKDATYVHDLSGRYTSVNRAAEKLSGYTKGEILGKSFINFVPSDQIENVREHLCRKLVEEGETSYESEVITKDGRRVAVEVNSHVIFENGVVVGVQGTARDITERKAAEEKLKSTSGQLRALSARLQSAREEEGTRIAREIHDELGAVLTSLKWDLEGADRILASPIEPSQITDLREKLHALGKLADVAITAIRRIASELRPSVLDDLGLVAAIEWQAQQFQARTGIVCCFDCSLEKLELSEEQSTAVFRILQEALTNVLRHAQATRVDIKINKENGYFTLSISDNGKGITESEKSEQQSLGILGMRERAHLIAGKIDIKGIEGKGTVVIVRVPISSQDRVLKMTR